MWRVQVNLILVGTIPSLCFSQFLGTKAKIWKKWQIGSQKLYFPAAAEKLIHDFATQKFAVQKILEPKCNLDSSNKPAIFRTKSGIARLNEAVK